VPSRLPFRLIDAFAETPFEGNSAGVVLGASDLADTQMQLIAREVNAAETAFVSGEITSERPMKLRWFTPTVEVDFCGHATLAAAQACAEQIGLDGLIDRPNGALEFETRVGLLPLRPERIPDRHSPIWWLGVPTPSWERAAINPANVCEALAITRAQFDPRVPIVRTRDADLIVMIESWPLLQSLRPNLPLIESWDARYHIRGLFVSCVGGVSDGVQATSRYFAPACGINEDPVTGSAHGQLVALLTDHNLAPREGNIAAMNCVQGIPGGRTGFVRALVEGTRDSGYKVLVGGCCQTTISGEIAVPA
jgi:PhzF family phenazine biosynthesis protein